MRKQIIIIDDDLEDIEIMRECVNYLGDDYVCDAFVDPCEALVYLQGATSIPFLIVIDINMPGMTGEQCVGEIAKIEKLKIVIVAVYSSAIPSQETLSSFKRSGAHFFQKPSSYGEMHLVFRNLIALSSDRAENE